VFGSIVINLFENVIKRTLTVNFPQGVITEGAGEGASQARVERRKRLALAII